LKAVFIIGTKLTIYVINVLIVADSLMD
jgi:hypothetical protein